MRFGTGAEAVADLRFRVRFAGVVVRRELPAKLGMNSFMVFFLFL
jgi:hypothetical protein